MAEPIPQRLATGSGLTPILPNRAAQQGEVVKQGARAAVNFTDVVYQMVTTTEYQKALADHQELLFEATALAEQESDSAKMTEVFERTYNERAGTIAKTVSDPTRNRDFAQKSNAQFGSAVASIQGLQLKRQRQQGVIELGRTAEVLRKRALQDNSQHNLRALQDELQAAAANAIGTGMDPARIDDWLRREISGMLEMVAIDMIHRNDFATLKRRMGYDDNWENYDPAADEFAGMDAETRVKIVGVGLQNSQRVIDDAKKKERRITQAHFIREQEVNGNASLELDGEMDEAVSRGLLDPVDAARMQGRAKRLRDQYADENGQYLMGLGWQTGVPGETSFDYTKQSHQDIAGIVYERVIKAKVQNSVHPWGAMEFYSKQGGMVFPQVRQAIEDAITQETVDPIEAVNASVLYRALNKRFPGQMARVGNLFQRADMIDRAKFYDIASPERAAELAMMNRVNKADVDQVALKRALTKEADGPDSLYDADFYGELQGQAVEYYGPESSGVEGISLSGYVSGDFFDAGHEEFEVGDDELPILPPDAMLTDIIRVLTPLAMRRGGRSGLTQGDYEAAFKDVRTNWAISRMGGAKVGWRKYAVEALVPPAPDGSLWTGYNADLEKATADEIMPWLPAGATTFTPRGEVTRNLIEEYVAERTQPKLSFAEIQEILPEIPSQDQLPPWLARVLSGTSPMTSGRESIRSMSGMDENGVEHLFPSIRATSEGGFSRGRGVPAGNGLERAVSGKAAFDEAMERGDSLVFPSPEAATRFSKGLSSLLGRVNRKTPIPGLDFDDEDRRELVDLYENSYYALIDPVEAGIRDFGGVMDFLFAGVVNTQIVSGPNRAKIIVEGDRNTRLEGAASYIVMLETEDDLISLAPLGLLDGRPLSRWVADPNKLLSFQNANGMDALRDFIGSEQSREKQETSAGSLDEAMLRLGLVGGDPSQLTPADDEVQIDDLGQHYSPLLQAP